MLQMMITLLLDLQKTKFTSIDYNIIRSIAKDKILLREMDKKTEYGKILPENSGNIVIMTDTEERIAFWKSSGLPVIAFSHKNNGNEDLMGSPWLVLSPRALSYEYLLEVHHRHYGIPIVILTTDRCLLREFTLRDLPLLLDLDAEQEDSTTKFFREGEEAPEVFLAAYIRYQYPFYGYGIYAAFRKETGEFLGLAGFFRTEEGSGERVGEKILEVSFCPDSPPAEKRKIPAADKQQEHEVEIGYVTKKSARRKGYAGEWIRGLISYARRDLDLYGIVARIPASNMASLKTALSAGGKLPAGQ